MRRFVIAACSVLCICAAAAAVIIYHTASSRISEIGHSSEGFIYNGIHFQRCYFYSADSDLIKLGRTNDGSDIVYSVERRESPNLISIVGSDNTYTYRSELYNIPNEGQVTRVFVDPQYRGRNDNILISQDDISMVCRITKTHGDLAQYHINNYYTDGNSIYFAYENCPVTVKENLAGYIAKSDGKWIFVSPEELNKSVHDNANPADLLGTEITDADILNWFNNSSLVKYIE